MDQGTEFGADFQQLCESRSILPVVTDLETPWQNSVVERDGALLKMAFEKACSLEVPTTEAGVNEPFVENSIDVWDELDFHPVNECLDDNFDSCQACWRTISLIPTRSCRTPTTRCGEARLCEWQPPTGASSPPTAER